MFSSYKEDIMNVYEITKEKVQKSIVNKIPDHDVSEKAD